MAPPRSKRDKRQSFKGFKEDRQSLFSSDHTTEDGMDLLPVGRTIAFDCPVEGVHKSDIHVQITGWFSEYVHLDLRTIDRTVTNTSETFAN